MEQAGGSEEKEDDLGRMLQDQAEYRSPAPDWPGTRRWASRPWSWPRATTPPGNLLPWCGAGGGVTVTDQYQYLYLYLHLYLYLYLYQYLYLNPPHFNIFGKDLKVKSLEKNPAYGRQ